eukprot:3907164-Pyramimonas_sp.AAC.1
MGALAGPVANALGARGLAREELLRLVPCLYGSATQRARELVTHEVGPRTWVHDGAQLTRRELCATVMHPGGTL